MGFWSKLFGFDKRWAVIEQKLLDQAEQQKQVHVKLELMAHDVVDHLYTVPNENKINSLEQQLIALQSSHDNLVNKSLGEHAELSELNIQVNTMQKLVWSEINPLLKRVTEIESNYEAYADNNIWAGPTSWQCDENSQCPPGQECVNNQCVDSDEQGVIDLATELIELKSATKLLTSELEIVKKTTSVRHTDIENMKSRIMSVIDQASENKDNIEDLERHHNHVHHLTEEEIGAYDTEPSPNPNPNRSSLRDGYGTPENYNE